MLPTIWAYHNEGQERYWEMLPTIWAYHNQGQERYWEMLPTIWAYHKEPRHLKKNNSRHAKQKNKNRFKKKPFSHNVQRITHPSREAVLAVTLWCHPIYPPNSQCPDDRVVTCVFSMSLL